MTDKEIIHIERIEEDKLIARISGNAAELIIMLAATMRADPNLKEIFLQAITLNRVADEKGMMHDDLIKVRKITEKEYNAS